MNKDSDEKRYVFWMLARERNAIGTFSWQRVMGTSLSEVFNRFTEKYEIHAVTKSAEFVRRLGDFR